MGDSVLAKLCALRALVAAPGDADKLAFWEQASATKPKRRQVGLKPKAWFDRSYRLNAPLMPKAAGGDRAALSRFLKACGMALPAGATAEVGDDGVTLKVHNLGREIERLETALMDRAVLLYDGASLEVDVEVCKNVGQVEGWLGRGADESKVQAGSGFEIVGVLTDGQYQLIQEAVAAKKKASIETLPTLRVLRGNVVDLLEGSSLQEGRVRWGCELDAVMGRDRFTIEATFDSEVIETDSNGDTLLSSQKVTNAITVWDGQWIALRKSSEGGLNDLVFVRMRVVKL